MAARLPAAQRLSPSQAAAVADAATADPAAEGELLDTAKTDTHRNLKDKATRKKAAATDSKQRADRIRSQRSGRIYDDAEGASNLHLRGPAIDIVALKSLLRPYEEAAFQAGSSGGVRDTYENRCYDAFFNLLADLQAAARGASQASASPAGSSEDPADHSADTSPADTPASSTGSIRPRPGADPARRPKAGDNVKVIVLIDHAALARGYTVAGETCHVVGVGPVPVSAVQEMLADAFLAAVIKKGKDVVNVAHLGRGCNAYQRTALEATGLRCSNIACNRTIALQIDHRVPYAENPETKLDNQDPLCPECHRRKTHHGWALEPGSGPRAFRPPGTDPSPPPPAEAVQPTDRRPRASGVLQPALC